MPESFDDVERQQIIDALYSGKKIQAIKQYRDATGSSLKEAKDFCDELERKLRQEQSEKFSHPPRAGCGTAALFLSLATAGIIIRFWA